MAGALGLVWGTEVRAREMALFSGVTSVCRRKFLPPTYREEPSTLRFLVCVAQKGSAVDVPQKNRRSHAISCVWRAGELCRDRAI